MGIYEDVEDLKAQIRKTVMSNNRNQMAELLKQAFSLCKKIQDLLKIAGEKDRKDLSLIMKDFRLFISEETTRLSKKMGLSEDEMRTYNEDPRNFTKDQWAVMQAIKQKFSAQTKEIRKVVKEREPTTKKEEPAPKKPMLPEGIPENWRELIANNPLIKDISFGTPTPPKKKKKSSVKRPKKDKWMKS